MLLINLMLNLLLIMSYIIISKLIIYNFYRNLYLRQNIYYRLRNYKISSLFHVLIDYYFFSYLSSLQNLNFILSYFHVVRYYLIQIIFLRTNIIYIIYYNLQFIFLYLLYPNIV